MSEKRTLSFSDVMDKSESEKLRVLLEQQEGQTITIHNGIREIWFHDETWQSELRLLFLGSYQITVSRVAFIRSAVIPLDSSMGI